MTAPSTRIFNLVGKDIWVFGGAGHLGQPTVSLLSAAGARILCVDLENRAEAFVSATRLEANVTPATAVATITAGFVTGITVTSGGSGYTSEPSVTLSGGGGSGATAKAILSEDKVALTLVLTAGSGYSTAPTVVVDAPPKPLSVKLEMVPKLTVEGPAELCSGGVCGQPEWSLDELDERDGGSRGHGSGRFVTGISGSILSWGC